MSFGENVDELVQKSTNDLHGAHTSWERVKLQDVSTLVNGFPFKSSWFNAENGTPIVRIRDVVKGLPGTFYRGSVDDPKMTYIENGDIAIGMDGDFNSKLWKGGRALLNQRVCTLSADKALYSHKFLSFTLPGYLKLINEHTSSVTVKHLSSKTVQEIPLPLPPLNEQHRITEKIESLFAQLDAGEAALRQVQTQLQRYRQSVLKAAVTGELTRAFRQRNAHRLESGADLLQRILETRRANWQGRGQYKEPAVPGTTGLPELPEGWVWASVDQLLRMKLANGRSVRTAAEGFPVLRLTALQDGVVDLTERKIGEWTLDDAEPYVVEEGDMLVSRGNGSKNLVGRGGRVADAPDPVAYPDTMIRVAIVLHSLSSEWFVWLWNSPFIRSQIEKAAKTTAGIYKINQTDIQSFVVPVPCYDEQNEIVARLRDVFEKADMLEQACQTELTRSQALRQSILKQAFTGQLVPQNPDDEPASELLARIRAEREAGEPRRGRR